MDALVWEAEPPHLRSPALVCAFAGWNDAAGAATTALTTAAESLEAEVIAQIDPEDFFDFQANRPTIRLTEGQTREIEWPGNVLLAATPQGSERDLVLLAGTEPNLRWRTFADGVAETAEGLGVEMVVTLGALIADVAHTLPVPITGLASDEQLVKRLDLTRSTYEGPTGVVGVVHDACGRKGISSASLWAAVPHYVAAVPNPKAALALLRRLEGLVGVAVEASGLEEEAESYESQVSRAVSANPEIEELVQRLEQEQSERLDILEDDVPSGEALARDFERYLRQQGND
ncbi:MAG TPA: PAC2 family protein [Solirubrobacterales bacterium]|jgi:proteasome assembly chaperone (PAC2) family protein